MKALIDPNHVLISSDGTEGKRVCQTSIEVFDVASPLFWVDCPEDLEVSSKMWDENNNSFVEYEPAESENNSEEESGEYIGPYAVRINGVLQPGVELDENGNIISIDGKPIKEIYVETGIHVPKQ
jgi:hypothetical protein